MPARRVSTASDAFPTLRLIARAQVAGAHDGTAIAAQSRVLRVTLIGLLATWLVGLVRLALAAGTPAPVRVRARAAQLRDR